jgi:sugar (pentulose or hexulose) kinase
MDAAKCIENGLGVLGIEFGSTRIKAVIIDESYKPIAEGGHEWENRFENGVWTYSLDDIWTGLKDCYADLKKNVKEKYGVTIKKFAAIGFSAMMHGYMAFDKDGNLMVPFRTWRNTITGEAAEKLTKEFNFNIPQRWSIAHLYQSILNGEEHVVKIDFLSTLAVYIHYMLTGKRVAGVGEASGMFPIDSSTGDYNASMVAKFDSLIADKGFPWKLRDILPKVLTAGDEAGILTEAGAKLLDESGDLEAGIPLCPPEGDAGTGMAATNSVAKRTGNVSAGTSIFAMVVLEKDLSKVYPIIDIVTTPDGSNVGMVHCNNCTSDINAWVNIIAEAIEATGGTVDKGKLYVTLFNKALEGDADCGGLISYNYLSGESVTGLDAGRPMFVRTPDAKFNLANFMRTHIYSAFATLKTGCDVMIRDEGVRVDTLYGHGGIFKTKGVAQSILAAALNSPVSVMETAGEGGAWGMALLAAYMIRKASGEALGDFLQTKVFAGQKGETIKPEAALAEGFDKFEEVYLKGLAAEKAAVENI